MFLCPSKRVEIRHKGYKASVDADEGRRRRHNTMVEIRMIDRDRALNEKRQRPEAMPLAAHSSVLENKLDCLSPLVQGVYSDDSSMQLEATTQFRKLSRSAYTYLDEAHSIGAVGKTGRGVCELLGVDPADVDIMMGTFTKSFGSCGGYIAASKEIIHHLKHTCPAHIYATSMSPPAVQQVISAIKVILGEDGSNRGISERNSKLL